MLKTRCLLLKIAMLFLDLIILLITLTCEFAVHRAGSQLNKENNVFKDAIGVKGLRFKLHANNYGNHGKHYGNLYGNYHDN